MTQINRKTRKKKKVGKHAYINKRETQQQHNENISKMPAALNS